MELVGIGRDEADHRAVRAQLKADGWAMRPATLSYRRQRIVETVGRVKLSAMIRRDLALLIRRALTGPQPLTS